MEDEIFARPHSVPVVVCKICQTGIRPKEILAHLRRRPHTKIPVAARQTISDAIQRWKKAELCQTYIPPKSLPAAIPGIPENLDGFLCTLNSFKDHYITRAVDGCGYIGISIRTIHNHWRDKHQDQIAAGLPTPEEQTKQATAKVRCQKIFRSGLGSHYVQIEEPQDGGTAGSGVHIDSLEAQFDKLASLGATTMESQAIQTAERDEANPWLRRTRWLTYLGALVPSELQQSVQRPDLEDPRTSEAIASAIWDAMESVARSSQKVAGLAGHTVRIAVVRIERDSLPTRPLQPYMNGEDIQRHSIPWQQILMFFARTQIPHEWQSPKYNFNTRQRSAWDYLWEMAELSIRHPAPELDSTEQFRQLGDQPTEDTTRPHAQNAKHVADTPSLYNEQTDDDTDDEYGVTSDHGQDDHHVPDPRQPENTITGVPPLTKLQRACLDFCIELLNQNIRSDEYECALVCAMAVQGSGVAGWRSCDSYPPILSKVIKLARFMVVHKALLLDPMAAQMMQHLHDPLATADWEVESPLNDPSFATSGRHTLGQPQAAATRSFTQWVVQQVDSFMVRGSQSPIEWMLDLRRYGLAVHFNTTTPGYVSWIGNDRLLYKDISFTMGEFRHFIHTMVSDTRSLLCNRLLFTDDQDPVPVIPWGALYDDVTHSAVGWSFLKDTRTTWPVDGPEWLLRRIRHSTTLSRRFLDPTGKQLHINAIDMYLNDVVMFRERLSIAVHICGGQPARGKELLSIRHRNTPGGGQRDLFIEDGMVTLVTKYHKGFYASNDTKVIHRYLPREIGELVVWYLWLVLPFVETLQKYRIQAGQQDHVRYHSPSVTLSITY